MVSLLAPGGDLGDADPLIRAALAAATTRAGYLDAVVALCSSRLLMPVMSPGTSAPRGATQVTELGAAVLTNDSGDSALLCFTGLDALQAWDARARPVPGTLDDLAATVGEAGARSLLIDVAGPVPMVIGPDLIAHLSQGRRLVRLTDGYGWLAVGGDGAGPGPGGGEASPS